MRKLFLCLFFTNTLLFGETSLQKEMIYDLEVAKHNLETKYAPKLWKRQIFGWNLEKSFLTAKKKILQNEPKNIQDYQKIVKHFFMSLKDYHVNVTFHSTRVNWFPLIVGQAQGRYFVTKINAKIPTEFRDFRCDEVEYDKLKELISHILPGDEIIAIDGKPVLQAVEENIDELRGGDRSPTGYAIGMRMLFNNNKPMADTFKLTVIHQGTTQPVEYTLPWAKVPEWIPEQPLNSEDKPNEWFDDHYYIGQTKRSKKKAADEIRKILSQDYSVDFVKPLLHQNYESDEESDEETEKDRREKGFLPVLGEVIWESDSKAFYAYLCKNEAGNKIGYIYIPTFSPPFICKMEELLEAINLFEVEADALVFDITNNPGGDAFFTYAILSTLSDRPLTTPRQRETLIQEDLISYAYINNLLTTVLKKPVIEDKKEEEEEEEIPNVAGLVINETVIEQLQEYLKTILKTWETGKRFSEPQPILGIKEIQPHPKGNYTKPLMVLVNELDFSCADIFPAILQDNKRAVIFGKRTAGAGGYVRKYQHTSRFGVAGYSITGSLLIRQNGQIIESIGVTPDIPYEFTLRDMQEDFADYAARVNKEVNKMIDQALN
jgi:C-terminal processing protease CtpA/Prc